MNEVYYLAYRYTLHHPISEFWLPRNETFFRAVRPFRKDPDFPECIGTIGMSRRTQLLSLCKIGRNGNLILSVQDKASLVSWIHAVFRKTFESL